MFSLLWYLVQGALTFSTSVYWGEHSQHYLSSFSAEETQTNSSKDFEGNGKDKCKICIILVPMLDFPLKNSDY